MTILRKISKGLAKYLFIPINVKLALFAFCIRHFFLGFANANKYLESLSQPCIIPILKTFGASIGKDCDFGTGLIFHNCFNYSNLIVGNNCHIGKNCFFDLKGEVIIEENVVISMKTTFITHQDMSKSDLRFRYPTIVGAVKINRNTYIGVNSTILKSITIGESSIIAAGSLVNCNIPSRTLVGGVPAKMIKIIT